MSMPSKTNPKLAISHHLSLQQLHSLHHWTQHRHAELAQQMLKITLIILKQGTNPKLNSERNELQQQVLNLIKQQHQIEHMHTRLLLQTTVLPQNTTATNQQPYHHNTQPSPL
jgi:hypothetical protein